MTKELLISSDELRMIAYALTFTERYCSKGYAPSDYELMERMKKEHLNLFGVKYTKPNNK